MKIQLCSNIKKISRFIKSLMILLFILTDYLICQDSTRVIPDGTQGETMKVGKADTALTIGNWYEFDGPGSSLS